MDLIEFIKTIVKEVRRLYDARVQYSIETEEQKIKEFEIERLKEELKMRTASAIEQDNQRQAEYRRRARDLTETVSWICNSE